MRNLVFIVSFLLGLLVQSQNLGYVDSLSQSIQTLPAKAKIKAIVDVPYDKVMANVKAFEPLADTAIQLSLEEKDTLLLAKSLEKKVLVLHFTSKTDEATLKTLELIKLYESLKMYDKAGETYCNLGWRIKYLDMDKAFEYMRKGLKLSEQNYNAKSINPSYDNYGALLVMRKQWDSALYYHNKSLKIKKELSDSIGIPFGYTHLADVYLKTGNYQWAEKYLDSSMIIRKNRNDTYGISDTHLYYGDLYFEKQDFKKAVQSFQNGYNLSKEHKYYPLQKYASEYLFRSYNKLNNHKEALDYHLVYSKLKDSVLNIETNAKIHALEIEFETEKKEKEILTQRADIAEKELDLSKKNIQMLGLALLAIVLGLLGYLFFSQQKLKNKQLQRENELKDALVKIETQSRLQEQRLRISRDLHDNIGAQLTFIISSLDNLKYGFKLPEKLTEKLGSISSFTTSTIQELRDTIWAMNKNDISFEDLEVRLSNFIEKAGKAKDDIVFNFELAKDLEKDLNFSSVKGMNIYRIIQEAVNNALKYAEADKIDLIISENDEGSLEFSVVDNGKGFDIEKTDLGNGLNNMKKRAQEIEAKLQINSKIGKGTSVDLYT